MTDGSYTTAFTVDRSPAEVFDAITDVRGWWSVEIEGNTDRLGEFGYRYEDMHRARIRITELDPGRKVSWFVVENYFDFTADKTEWTGTTLTFEISEVPDATEVRFTHHGLVPEYECFDACSTGWGVAINTSLRNLITTGEGQPNGAGVETEQVG